MRQVWSVCVFVAALACAAHNANADVLFEDDFNTENGGTGAVNYAGFAQWTVSDGAVDLIGNGFFDLYPGNGLFVDLEGSAQNAGIMTSIPIAVVPGEYLLEFDLGIHGGFGEASMTVSFGTDYSEGFVEAQANTTTFTPISRPFTVTSAGSFSLVFNHDGGDDFGLVIDNVRISDIPEPASIVLVGIAGVLGAAAVRSNGRRERRRTSED